MQIKKNLFCLFSLIAPICSLNAAYSQGYDERWNFLGDWLYLRRAGGDNKSLVKAPEIVNGQVTLNTIVDTEDLIQGFDWESGIRGAVTYRSSDQASLEAAYLYAYPWKSKEKVTRSRSLFIPFTDPRFAAVMHMSDKATFSYHSEFQNGELTYWRHVTPRRVNYFSFSWLMGGRFVYLREAFNEHFIKGSLILKHRIRTLNLLYGPQLGGVLEWNPMKNLTWALSLRTSGLLNDAKNKSTLKVIDETPIDFDKKRWSASFLIEARGSLTYYWGPYFSFHAGYQVLWVNKLALAPNQLDRKARPRPHINTDGKVIIDGGFVGMSIAF